MVSSYAIKQYTVHRKEKNNTYRKCNVQGTTGSVYLCLINRMSLKDFYMNCLGCVNKKVILAIVITFIEYCRKSVNQ